VPGIRTVRSNTTRGSCDISATFNWGLDMISATLQVESAVAQVLPSLPAGLHYEVRRMDPTVFPVMGLSLTSATETQVRLRDIALYDLRPVIATVPGVAKIKVLGGRREEYRISVDLHKLEAAQLTLDDVLRGVSASSVVRSVGRIEDNERLYLILSNTQFSGKQALENVIVRRGPTGMVLLSDIATIEDTTEPAWTRVTADGREAVLINIYQQPKGNTVRISKQIRDRITAFRSRLPKDVTLRVWYDQSTLINASSTSVRDAILIGIALAVLVLLLFLRNWRITLVVSIVVPAVLAATPLLLQVFHMGLNMMTLGGMAAAVGLIIDDVIVMVEHIMARIEAPQADGSSSIVTAAREMMPAVTGSSLATIVIFAPLAFLTGLTGAFFKSLSLTMAVALTLSYLFAVTAVPVLSRLLLAGRLGPTRGKSGKAGKGRVLAWYQRALTGLLRHPLLLLLVVVPLLLLGWFGYRQVGSGFMPPMDEGGFILDYRTPPGTSLSETDRRLRLVEHILKTTPEVNTYSRRTGLSLGGFVTEANEGDFFVRLKSMPRRPIEAVMAEVRQRVLHRVPGMEIELAQLMEDLLGDLTAVPQPIEVKLFGSDVALLRRQADRVAQAISHISNVVDVKNGVVLAGDQVEIHVDRLKAQLLGLKPEDVSRICEVALKGAVVTHVEKEQKMVPVRVWTASPQRSDIARIRRIRLQTPQGLNVPLDRVATLRTLKGMPQIVREDLKTMVAVTGRISGRDLGSVVKDVKRVVRGLHLPRGVSVRYGGLYRQQQKSFRGLIAVLVAAIALVFILLLVIYERFAAPIAILITDFLAVTGVFAGLWWSGSELDVSSMMGLTMIVGIASEAAIFYMTQWQDLPADMDMRTRLVEAGRKRARPILMTTVAAILALLPLALGLGEGASMLKPLAIAIISGLALACPLVLLFLPVLFFLLTRIRLRPSM